MEKFEIDSEKKLEIFNIFVEKAKDALETLVDEIRGNIKKYEQAIDATKSEIAETESSKAKCEQEIVKMDGKIDKIKETIENVESTYKKIVDAYSSTSKGETKELYSDIIDGAKANCDKDVEKNRSEIARLTSDIEAIKNNIAEFTKMIDELNQDLEEYNHELYRYNKSLEYMEKLNEKTSVDLENISLKEEPKKKTEPKPVKKSAPKKEKETVEVIPEKTPELIEEEPVEIEEPLLDIIDADEEDGAELVLDNDDFDVEEPEKPEEKEVKADINFEDSLKQIYDLTGYKPKKEEKTEEVEKKPEINNPIYSDNLENLFADALSEDIKPEKEIINKFEENDMSEWERILNGADDILTSLTPIAETKEEKISEPVGEVKKTIDENITDTINQLLKPYGTSFENLIKLTSDKITYKNGSSIPFEVTTDDVIKAVNSVDGIDLKAMRTVGPEITLLRKIKSMKEGRE